MRRFELHLIISLFALLSQIVAPFGAAYARLHADPFGPQVSPICDHVSEPGHDPAPQDHEDSSCCTMCGAIHAAFPAPSDVPDSIAAPQPVPRRLSFETTVPLPAGRLIPPLARPRAPPAFS